MGGGLDESKVGRYWMIFFSMKGGSDENEINLKKKAEAHKVLKSSLGLSRALLRTVPHQMSDIQGAIMR